MHTGGSLKWFHSAITFLPPTYQVGIHSSPYPHPHTHTLTDSHTQTQNLMSPSSISTWHHRTVMVSFNSEYISLTDSIHSPSSPLTSSNVGSFYPSLSGLISLLHLCCHQCVILTLLLCILLLKSLEQNEKDGSHVEKPLKMLVSAFSFYGRQIGLLMELQCSSQVRLERIHF